MKTSELIARHEKDFEEILKSREITLSVLRQLPASIEVEAVYPHGAYAQASIILPEGKAHDLYEYLIMLPPYGLSKNSSAYTPEIKPDNPGNIAPVTAALEYSEYPVHGEARRDTARVKVNAKFNWYTKIGDILTEVDMPFHWSMTNERKYMEGRLIKQTLWKEHDTHFIEFMGGHAIIWWEQDTDLKEMQKIIKE